MNVIQFLSSYMKFRYNSISSLKISLAISSIWRSLMCVKKENIFSIQQEYNMEVNTIPEIFDANED